MNKKKKHEREQIVRELPNEIVAMLSEKLKMEEK